MPYCELLVVQCTHSKHTMLSQPAVCCCSGPPSASQQCAVVLASCTSPMLHAHSLDTHMCCAECSGCSCSSINAVRDQTQDRPGLQSAAVRGSRRLRGLVAGLGPWRHTCQGFCQRAQRSPACVGALHFPHDGHASIAAWVAFSHAVTSTPVPTCVPGVVIAAWGRLLLLLLPWVLERSLG